MICFYLYKNVILVFTEFYFVIFNGFSGQNFFPDWLCMLYNILFSSWHCLIAFYLEKDVNDHLSFRYSKIYQAGQLGKTFNFLVFWKWILMAMVHGAFCFYLPIISSTAALSDSG
jgi:phospholipid-transporting ATPase